jgi:hypothetical protein
MIAPKGGASEPADTLLLGKAGGAAAVRLSTCNFIGCPVIMTFMELRAAPCA